MYVLCPSDSFHCVWELGYFTFVVLYSCFRVFRHECRLHTAITHVISALERLRLTHDYAIGIHVRLNLTYTFVTRVIAVCNVH